MSALASGNTAHIIAVMGIAYSRQIHAAIHQAGGITHDPAAVGDHISVLGPGESHSLYVKFVDLQAAGGYSGIHLGPVFAIGYGTGAESGDAAGETLAADTALGTAICYAAVVFTGDAAHIVQSGDLAVKTAIVYAAVAGANQAAHLAAAVVRFHPALKVQVADAALCLEVAEKALMRAVGSQHEITYGVAAAVKTAAEAGYGVKGSALQIQITVQLNLQACRIFHQGAVPGKVPQLLHRGDMQHLILSKGSG